MIFLMVGPIWFSQQHSVWKSGLKTRKRLEKDRTGLEKGPDCSLGLSYLKIKDWKKTGLWYPLIIPSKMAKDHAN